MLELKVSRCCELNDERQSSALLFVGKISRNDEYIATVIINDALSSSYIATFDHKSWEGLREEGEFSTDEEFIAELADENNLLSVERSECVQVKWIRPDQDGLTFKFCTLTLNQGSTLIYDIVDALLKERNLHHSNAVERETIVASMERRLELLGKRVEEMDDYRRNLSNTLISKFVAIQNAKTSS
uniref:GOLD domain-containing protein n=1 Tax=Elaeophora elaphi TaxID=1147741 RepID=A0A0R3RU17_9BILA